jgi:hypothetical protein|tara:strand:+ start:213 stop:725 length:513 start_codon:yes stop_codon:yes gene_type:complete
MKIILKSIKHKKIDKKILNKIVNLKIEEWDYNKKLQFKWMNAKLNDDDLHNLLIINDIICGYTCLRVKQFTYKRVNKEIYYFDTLIIGKKFRSKIINKKKYSDILMKFNMKIINNDFSLAILVCKKQLVKFYEKYEWTISKSFKINKNIKYFRMLFNPKKNVFKNKNITI